MLVTYPRVEDEFATVAKLAQGHSIARFGDGELKLMGGAEYVREPPNAALAAELRRIIAAPAHGCLVGVWTMDSRSPKHASMCRHRRRFLHYMEPGVRYYSSQISRPDSAPWIRTREYAEAVASLWRGKRIVVICESESSTLRAIRLTDAPIHIVCPRFGAYAHIDEYVEAVKQAKPDVVIASVGPTATCLADRLCRLGVQTIDFGRGGFVGRLLT